MLFHNQPEIANMQTEKFYMNTKTGSVDTKDGWDYENESGETVNAVDLGEVIEVEKDEEGNWVEV
jgi:hypothetical protein